VARFGNVARAGDGERLGGALGQGMERGDLAAIRRATQTECPLGEAGFVERSEAKFPVRLRPLPPGPVARMGVQGERGLWSPQGKRVKRLFSNQSPWFDS